MIQNPVGSRYMCLKFQVVHEAGVKSGANIDKHKRVATFEEKKTLKKEHK